jgi:hypothetical protein
LEFVETDGITYTVDVDPPFAGGQTVVVTATLTDAGAGWPAELPDEWERTSPTTAIWPHTFAEVSCTPVTPVAPDVVAARCAAEVAVAGSVVLASTPGLIYAVVPAGPHDPAVDTDVVVTATVLDGFAWAESAAAPVGFVRRAPAAGRAEQTPLPEGWTWVSPTEATYALTLAAAPVCPEVAPETVPTSTPGLETETGPAPDTETGPAPETETGPANEAAPVTTVGPATTAAPGSTVPGGPTTTATAGVEPTTTVTGPIPPTGASGVPVRLVVALMAVAAGMLMTALSRRRMRSPD